jgi:hypothetical protein
MNKIGYKYVRPILVYSNYFSKVNLETNIKDSIDIVQGQWLIKAIRDNENFDMNPEIVNVLKEISSK